MQSAKARRAPDRRKATREEDGRRRLNHRSSPLGAAGTLAVLVALCGCGGGGGGNSGGGGNGGGGGTSTPTITSVSVSCPSSSVGTGQTLQCSATVSGTGSYGSAVTWSVNAIAGGNTTLGTISMSGLYTAPGTVPTPYTVSVTATSAVDSTKSASANLIVAGTIATVTQPITAASGGTITLPDGSSVTIAAGLLPLDQPITLSEVSWLPNQPPDTSLVEVGPGLVLGFSTAVQVNPAAYAGPSGTIAAATLNTAESTQPPISASFNLGNNASSDLTGSAPFVDFVDGAHLHHFMGAAGNVDSTRASANLSISPAEWQATGYLNTSISSLNMTFSNVSFTGTTALSPFNIGAVTLSNNSNATLDAWNQGWSCPAGGLGKTLVAVHGMNASVESTFPTADGTIQSIKTHGNYQSVLGFDYDWTADIKNNGRLLATFLDDVAACPAATIDVEAHSEGVPVALYATAQMNQGSRGAVKHLIALAGPIMGTPMAPGGDTLACYFFNTQKLWLPAPVVKGVFGGIAAVLPLPFASELAPSKPGSGDYLDTIRTAISGASLTNAPQIVVIAGNDPAAGGPDGSTLKSCGALIQASGYGPSDGFIPLTSALAYQPTVGHNVLEAYPFSPFPSDHETLIDNPAVIASVGGMANATSAPTSLALSAAPACSDSVVCIGGPGTLFSLDGEGYSTTLIDKGFELDASGTIQEADFSTADGSIPSSIWVYPTFCSTSPSTKMFFAENPSTDQPSNAVTAEVDSSACASNPVPEVLSLSPSSLKVGAAAQTLAIDGLGFVSNSTVTYDGTARPVTFVSPAELTIDLSSSDLATSGSHPIVVTNPAPGGGSSSPVNFVVTAATVIISPTAVSVPMGGVQTLSATIAGGGGVIWSVQEGPGGGTISASGIYTAPNQAGTYHVVATSVADPSQSAAATVTVTSGPAITTLHSFNHATEGANPWAVLVAGTGSVMYGTTTAGGDLSCSYITSFSGCGTLFSIDTLGKVTTLHSFSGQDGAYPETSLTLGSGGTLYGATNFGGSDTAGCVVAGTSIQAGCGMIFSYDSSGTFDSLFSFGPYSSSLGASPGSSLVQTSGGTLYGANAVGGNEVCTGTLGSSSQPGCGVIFSLTSASSPTTLHSFAGSEGSYPGASLLALNGNFFGTTVGGGNLSCSSYASSGCGTVFEMTPSGFVTDLHKFGGSDGAAPYASLILGSDGKMYGTTLFGGSTTCNGGASWQGCGTIFRIDTAGNLVPLHSFSGPDGAYPAQLIQATDGYFYGTTESGGDAACTGRYGPGCGTVFRMDSSGNVTVLYSFTGNSDGSWPESGVMQGSDGNLYGTAAYGGVNDDGVVFRISNLTALSTSTSQSNIEPAVKPAVTPPRVTRPHVGAPGPAAPGQP